MVNEGSAGRKVLVSGGGVAGSTVAYWLKRHGYEPTVVERAPGLRQGGQAVDFRGPALTVLERMDLLERVRAHDTGIGDCTIVDDDGVPYAVMPAVLYAGELEVLIDELIAILFETAAGAGVEYRFGDSITSLTPDDHGVTATFERAPAQKFDFVVGADGVHSRVRGLAFGPEEQFSRYLGCSYAYYGVDNYLNLDHEGIGVGDGGTVALSVFSIKHNKEARVGVLFKSDQDVSRDPARHARAVRDAAGHLGWEAPALLAKLESAGDLYFDAMTQIHMDTWSQGRVVLVGDAAHGAAPTSGRGTSQALVGAYVLAGELAAADAAGAGHRAAFAAYESAMRGYVTANQEIGVQGSQYMFVRPTQEMFDALAAQAGEAGPEHDAEMVLKTY